MIPDGNLDLHTSVWLNTKITLKKKNLQLFQSLLKDQGLFKAKMTYVDVKRMEI